MSVDFDVRLPRTVVSDMHDRYTADLATCQYKINEEKVASRRLLDILYTERESLRERIAVLWAGLYPNDAEGANRPRPRM